MGKHTFQMYYRIDESRKCGNVIGRRVLTVKETNVKWGEARKNP